MRGQVERERLHQTLGGDTKLAGRRKGYLYREFGAGKKPPRMKMRMSGSCDVKATRTKPHPADTPSELIIIIIIMIIIMRPLIYSNKYKYNNKSECLFIMTF